MIDSVSNRGLVSIDILRGFAATGVFFYHQHIGLLLAKTTGWAFLDETDNFGATYAVPLFFLLSGFCIHLPNIKYVKKNQALPLTNYFKRRFIRIYPPYLAALVFSIIADILTVNNYTVNARDVMAHVFLLQGFLDPYFNTINLVLWTISIEIALYLLYPLFYYVRLKTSLKTALAIVFLISAISIASVKFFGFHSKVSFFFVPNIWFGWCAGAFIAESFILTPLELKKTFYKFVYAVILLCFFVLGKANLAVIQYPFLILIWTAPLIITLSFEHKLTNNNSIAIRLLTCLGLSSYSLYLFHVPLIALKNYFVHLIIPFQLQKPALLLGVLVIPIASWFCYQLVERPFMRKKTVVLR